MQYRLYPIALSLLLALAACVPGAAEYTRSEARNELRVDGSASQATVAFGAGSDRLAASQAAQLDRLVLNGTIRSADRISITAAGSPSLAQRRFAAISGELLRYGIVAGAGPLDGVPPNRAVIIIARYAVISPPCPNWSKSPASDFTNEPSSNFGCANASNLGMMVASPADLVSGRPLAQADGEPEVAAVNRYLNDQVTPLISVAVGPIASTSGAAAPAAAPAAGGGQY